MAKAGRLVKELMVRELTQILSERPNFFVASVGLLQAPETDTLRKRLRGVQASMLMVKRTLGSRGLAGLELNGRAADLLTGSVALVFPGGEIIPVAKLLLDFVKESQEKLAIRGGVVDGQLLDAKRFQEVAHLPPKLQLVAQLIVTIESPLADVVWTLDRVFSDLTWILEEASKKEGTPNA